MSFITFWWNLSTNFVVFVGINEKARRKRKQNHWIGMRWRCTVKYIQPGIILSHNHLAYRICVCVFEYEKKSHTHINYRKWKMCAPKRSTTPEILYKIDESVGKRVERRSLSHAIGMPVYYTRYGALNACIKYMKRNRLYMLWSTFILATVNFSRLFYQNWRHFGKTFRSQYGYTIDLV